MDRLRLHQELFLFAHDDDGNPYIHQPSLSAGLAGAVLLDLVLADNLAISDGKVAVRGRHPLGDPVADGLLAAIAETHDRRHLSSWIRAIAGDIYHRSSGGLLAAGLLSRMTSRRSFGRRQDLLRPTDRYAVYGRTYPDLQCAALCGLVAAVRVERCLHFNLPASEIVTTLRRIAEQNCPQAIDVLAAVDATIGQLAVQVYR
jgi:hypothetical protein